VEEEKVKRGLVMGRGGRGGYFRFQNVFYMILLFIIRRLITHPSIPFRNENLALRIDVPGRRFRGRGGEE